MLDKAKSAIIKFLHWIKYLLWDKPVSKPEPIKAEEVSSQWIVIDYKGQFIQLHMNEIPIWNEMSREDRRAMARKTASQVKKGLIKFVKINGKMVCVKNRDYDALAQKAKEAKHGI